MTDSDKIEMWKPKRTNCLLWAFVMWWKYGGRVKYTCSLYGWWPHARWSPGKGRVFEFAPHKHKRGLLFPPPIFSGHIQEVLSVTIGTRLAVDGHIRTNYFDLTPL